MALEQFQTEENIPSEVPAEVPAELPVAKPKVSKEGAYANDQAIRLHQKRAEYDQHIQRLIDKFSNRQLNYNPQLLALGEGLLTPGKTGSFFEGLGLGMKGYREAGEKMQEQDITNAKLENELRTGQIGQLTEDVKLQRELNADDIRRQLYEKRIAGKKTPTVGLDGKPNISDILSSPSQSFDTMLSLDYILAQPKYMQKELLDLYKVQQEDLKAQTEKSKSTEFNVPFKGLVKGNIYQSEGIERLRTHPWYQSLPIEEKKKAMQEAYAQLGIGEEQPLEESVSVTTKAGDGTKQPTLETTSQRELRKEIEKTQSVEDIKAAKEVQKKDLGEITKVTDAAKTQLVSGNEMFKYADDPQMKQIFGILQKGGYLNAFLTALREPVTIVTPSGPISVGIGNIEEILRVANVKDPALLDTAQKFKSLSKQVETNMTRILLGGEGQITEGERAIVRDIVPTLSDSPKVVQAKAELLVARAQFDIERAKAFQAYIRKNKNATRFEFENEPDSPYQKLWYDYQKHTAEISDAYRTDGKKTPIGVVGEKKSTQPTKKGSLWESIQRAKEAE
jgi:hypothetical protein